ncbi:MAG TPA: glycoside hydrolase family 2 TIM barrel-domain containing protein [Sphaerochaeta sp.]|nr:glycoside hydrolase family 2 TIM barrel-domain containing protein [Sphaerochaeta sp.]
MNNLPKNEHPTPQFMRNDWINLNGVWTYTINMRPPYFSDKRSYNHEEKSTGFDKTIVVPFAPESELSTVAYKDMIFSMFYHRSIEIPQSFAGKKVLLHFGAVFYHADVFIDGQMVDFHDGGSTPFAVDITAYVRAGGQHNLVVKATSNLQDGSIPSGKQSSFMHSYKCFYTRTTGIWQTVWMEAVDHRGLRDVKMECDIDSRKLSITPYFYSVGKDMTLTCTVVDEGTVVATYEGKAKEGIPVSIAIPSMKLWSCDDPHLYSLQFSTSIGGASIDTVSSYMGMRNVEIHGGQVYLNHKKLYQRLVLDQGYYPKSQWTSPDDESLRQDILLGKNAGFNGARLHQKVFEPRYLYWADRLGYLCWGESPSWGLEYNDESLPARNFLSEWAEILQRDRNHPSIILWTPLNETFRFTDAHAHRRLHRDAYNLCKMLDASRPVNDSSGYVHFITDIWTVHTYEQIPAKFAGRLALKDGKPFRNFPEFESEYTGQPYLVDEYGGIKWDPETQQENDLLLGQNLVSWGYGESPKTLEEFYHRLEDLTNQLLALEHISGYCYTQLTDVEQEKNGIYLYDRKLKFDMERIRAIFSKVPMGFGE